VHATLAQRAGGFGQVLQRRAVAPARVAQDGQHLLVAEPAGVVLAAPAEREGQRRHRALRRLAGQETRVVDAAADHLAVPQALQLGFGRFGPHAVDEAAAGAAGHQREHQARLLRRAAVDLRAHAQRAVPSAHQSRAVLGGLELRAPDQRGVAEDPQVAASAPLRAQQRQPGGGVVRAGAHGCERAAGRESRFMVFIVGNGSIAMTMRRAAPRCPREALHEIAM